jgi:hypothetical protein
MEEGEAAEGPSTSRMMRTVSGSTPTRTCGSSNRRSAPAPTARARGQIVLCGAARAAASWAAPGLTG